MGHGQHHQVGGGDQGFPVGAGAENGPTHHRPGVEALQGGDPTGQPRSHHHRTGGALEHEEHVGRRLLLAADRLPEAEAQQLGLAGQLLEQGLGLVGQEGKRFEQFQQLGGIRHHSLPGSKDSGCAVSVIVVPSRLG